MIIIFVCFQSLDAPKEVAKKQPPKNFEMSHGCSDKPYTDDFIHQFLISRNLDVKTIRKWEDCSDDIIIRHGVTNTHPESSFFTVHTHRKILSNEEIKHFVGNHFHKDSFALPHVDDRLNSLHCSAERDSQRTRKHERTLKPNQDQLLAIQDSLTRYVGLFFSSIV